MSIELNGKKILSLRSVWLRALAPVAVASFTTGYAVANESIAVGIVGIACAWGLNALSHLPTAAQVGVAIMDTDVDAQKKNDIS